MKTSRTVLYAALRARDPRYDGKFFVGKKTTGLYCRSICTSRLPDLQNVRFFASAAAAEQAGFRPCPKCRPELAPDNAPADCPASLAERTAHLLAENCNRALTAEDLSQMLGAAPEKIEQDFFQAYQATPRQYRETGQYLLARNLLGAGTLPVREVAAAAGYGSERALRAAFVRRDSLTPGRFRQSLRPPKTAAGMIRVEIGYRPPFRFDLLLDFLRPRCIPAVEYAGENFYERTAALQDAEGKLCAGWFRVRDNPASCRLVLEVSPGLLPVLPQLLSRVKQLFDCAADPAVIRAALQKLDRLRPGMNVPGIRLPGCFDPFEMGVRAILGQQITVKAATTLSGRYARAFGTPIQTGSEHLSLLTPEAERIATLPGRIEDALGPLGIIAARARSIKALASGVVSGSLSFAWGADPGPLIRALDDLPGIGPWTAQYLSMRSLSWRDAFPSSDLGIVREFPQLNQKEIQALFEDFRPWRAYAVLCIWNAHAQKGR